MDGVEGVDCWGVYAQKAGARCTRLPRAPGLGLSRSEDALRSVFAALASRLAKEILFWRRFAARFGTRQISACRRRHARRQGPTSPAGSAATLSSAALASLMLRVRAAQRSAARSRRGAGGDSAPGRRARRWAARGPWGTGLQANGHLHAAHGVSARPEVRPPARVQATSVVAGAGPLAGSAAPAGWLLEGGHPTRVAPSDECHGLEQPFSTPAQREQLLHWSHTLGPTSSEALVHLCPDGR